MHRSQIEALAERNLGNRINHKADFPTLRGTLISNLWDGSHAIRAVTNDTIHTLQAVLDDTSDSGSFLKLRFVH